MKWGKVFQILFMPREFYFFVYNFYLIFFVLYLKISACFLSPVKFNLIRNDQARWRFEKIILKLIKKYKMNSCFLCETRKVCLFIAWFTYKCTGCRWCIYKQELIDYLNSLGQKLTNKKLKFTLQKVLHSIKWYLAVSIFTSSIYLFISIIISIVKAISELKLYWLVSSVMDSSPNWICTARMFVTIDLWLP